MTDPIPHFIPGWIQLRHRMQSPGGDIIYTFSCTPQTPGTRYTGAQLALLAQDFKNNALASLGTVTSSLVKFIDVVANDLGDALGEQGVYPYPANTFGGSTGELLPANVALASTWRTKYRGPKYRGRTYWGGFTEAAFNGDILTSAFTLAMATIIGNILVYHGPSTVPVNMVVASRKWQLLTPIVNTNLTTIADTMKRRLAGHGR